eukprot:scaffold17688_cov18-Prasinocladus_malaysianus.AAC.1
MGGWPITWRLYETAQGGWPPMILLVSFAAKESTPCAVHGHCMNSRVHHNQTANVVYRKKHVWLVWPWETEQTSPHDGQRPTSESGRRQNA